MKTLLYKLLEWAQRIPCLTRFVRRILAYLSGGFVDLYGCPNSKRTVRLQLKKQLYKK